MQLTFQDPYRTRVREQESRPGAMVNSTETEKMSGLWHSGAPDERKQSCVAICHIASAEIIRSAMSSTLKRLHTDPAWTLLRAYPVIVPLLVHPHRR
jgi:hypothetical protein